MTSEPVPYVRRLRAELVQAVGRAQTRHSRRRLVAATATAALAVALLLGIELAGDGHRSTALAVTKHDGWITLRISDATADPREMTNELRAAGIEGVVRVHPVSPSLVGKWAAVETRPPAPAAPGESVSATELANEPPGRRDRGDVDRLLSIDFAPEALRVPEDFRVRVLLTAGRAPRDGELYAESGSAFAAGEPLHCSGIERLSPAGAKRAIAAKGYEVHTVVQPAAARSGKPTARRADVDAVVGAQLLSTRPMAAGVGAPTSRREIVLYVSSSRTAPAPYGIPRQDCAP